LHTIAPSPNEITIAKTVPAAARVSSTIRLAAESFDGFTGPPRPVIVRRRF
jgi:hypothetical protein